MDIKIIFFFRKGIALVTIHSWYIIRQEVSSPPKRFFLSLFSIIVLLIGWSFLARFLINVGTSRFSANWCYWISYIRRQFQSFMFLVLIYYLREMSCTHSFFIVINTVENRSSRFCSDIWICILICISINVIDDFIENKRADRSLIKKYFL